MSFEGPFALKYTEENRLLVSTGQGVHVQRHELTHCTHITDNIICILNRYLFTFQKDWICAACWCKWVCMLVCVCSLSDASGAFAEMKVFWWGVDTWTRDSCILIYRTSDKAFLSLVLTPLCPIHSLIWKTLQTPGSSASASATGHETKIGSL